MDRSIRLEHDSGSAEALARPAVLLRALEASHKLSLPRTLQWTHAGCVAADFSEAGAREPRLGGSVPNPPNPREGSPEPPTDADRPGAIFRTREVFSKTPSQCDSNLGRLVLAFLAFFGTTGLMLAVASAQTGSATPTTRLASGGFSTCRIHASELACWGLNTHGQLGEQADRVIRHLTEPTILVPLSTTGDQGSSDLSMSPDGQVACRITQGRVQCRGSDASLTVRVLPTLTSIRTCNDTACRPRWSDVPGLSDVRQVAVGVDHACAVDSAGSVFCWGSHAAGECGGGLADQCDGVSCVRSPRRVELGSPAHAITASYSTSCAVTTAGAVRCWGTNDVGQLGAATASPCTENGEAYACSSAPVEPLGLSHDVTNVALGFGFGCALQRSGLVTCWGENTFGQVGRRASEVPVRPSVISALDGVQSIAVGQDHVCAVLRDGTVRCWGNNETGQLGVVTSEMCSSPDGNVACSSTPTRVHSVDDASIVSVGVSHSCVLRGARGTPSCWGDNSGGQLGRGHTDESPGVAQVARRTTAMPAHELGAFAIALASGTDHSCALMWDRHVACWGGNTFGQLGNGRSAASSTPVNVPGIDHVTHLSAGGGTTCAVRQEDPSIFPEMHCWGENASRLIPNVESDDVRSPMRMPTNTENSINYALIGTGHACSGSICWGDNRFGQLGLGHDRAVPSSWAFVGISLDFSSLSQPQSDHIDFMVALPAHAGGLLAVGGGFTCIPGQPSRDGTEGQVMCWGRNDRGQLGTRAGNHSPRPQRVLGLPNANSQSSPVQLALANTGHACALVGDAPWCWGDNSRGQLGVGSTTNHIGARAVQGASSVTIMRVRVAAGTGAHTCALSSDGAVSCWGANDRGQVGDGTVVDRPVPTVIPRMAGVVDISLGESSTCVLLDSGEVRCFGGNDTGQVGNGSTRDQRSAVRVRFEGPSEEIQTAAQHARRARDMIATTPTRQQPTPSGSHGAGCPGGVDPLACACCTRCGGRLNAATADCTGIDERCLYGCFNSGGAQLPFGH